MFKRFFSHTPRPGSILGFDTLNPAALPGAGLFQSFLSMPLTSKRTSAGSGPKPDGWWRTLLEQWVPLTRATGPLWALTPYCLPSHSFLLSPLFFFSPSPWKWKEAWETACCFVLTAWICCWWPASYGAPKLPFTFSPSSLTSSRERTTVWSH